VTSTTLDPNVRALWDAAYVLGVAKTEAAAALGDVGSIPTTAVVSGSSSIQAVMDCIKHAESGDYAEHSHIYDGSGAYQYTPGTFVAWFARWASATGYHGPSYALAYEAPSWIQDAVTAYALTHGGAGNWSMRYGNDSCTAGLPGGG